MTLAPWRGGGSPEVDPAAIRQVKSPAGGLEAEEGSQAEG